MIRYKFLIQLTNIDEATFTGTYTTWFWSVGVQNVSKYTENIEDFKHSISKKVKNILVVNLRNVEYGASQVEAEFYL